MLRAAIIHHSPVVLSARSAACHRLSEILCNIGSRLHKITAAERARALTVHHSPTQEEYASDQEQMCSGSKDQHSTED